MCKASALNTILAVSGVTHKVYPNMVVCAKGDHYMFLLIRCSLEAGLICAGLYATDETNTRTDLVGPISM